MLWKGHFLSMLLSTPVFFAFFLVVCLLFWAARGRRRLQQGILLASNLFFLLKFGPVYLLLSLAATADFFLAWGMKGVEGRRRLSLVGASLLLNLGLLFALKLMPVVAGDRMAWLFPLSLSFYCFQSLSYTIDVYRGDAEPTTDGLAYLSMALFFPSMLAGPIPRTAKLLRAVVKPFRLTDGMAGRALLLIATGLVKKLLIADYLADNLVNRVFDTPTLYSGLENLVGVYGYALQLFFDFSGYTDLAMGVALLLGFELPENFRRPYLAVNLQDFWKRWHISFSSWLTDYCFESLPKSRRFAPLTYGYAFVLTFLLGGLWHGLSWNFLIWGALHGCGLWVFWMYVVWRKRRGAVSREGSLAGRVAGGFLTFQYVCLTWVFFRAADVAGAWAVLRQIGTGTWSAGNVSAPVLGVMALAVVGHSLPPRVFGESERWAERLPFWAQGCALAGVVLVIQTLAGQGSAPFVYGNF